MRRIQIEGDDREFLMDPQGQIFDMKGQFIGTANTNELEELQEDGMHNGNSQQQQQQEEGGWENNVGGHNQHEEMMLLDDDEDNQPGINNQVTNMTDGRAQVASY